MSTKLLRIFHSSWPSCLLALAVLAAAGRLPAGDPDSPPKPQADGDEGVVEFPYVIETTETHGDASSTKAKQGFNIELQLTGDEEPIDEAASEARSQVHGRRTSRQADCPAAGCASRSIRISKLAPRAAAIHHDGPQGPQMEAEIKELIHSLGSILRGTEFDDSNSNEQCDGQSGHCQHGECSHSHCTCANCEVECGQACEAAHHGADHGACACHGCSCAGGASHCDSAGHCGATCHCGAVRHCGATCHCGSGHAACACAQEDGAKHCACVCADQQHTGTACSGCNGGCCCGQKCAWVQINGGDAKCECGAKCACGQNCRCAKCSCGRDASCGGHSHQRAGAVIGVDFEDLQSQRDEADENCSDAPLWTPLGSEKPQGRVIDALRAASQQLESAANLMEEENLYYRADQLRELAGQLRSEARSAQGGWTLQPLSSTAGEPPPGAQRDLHLEIEALKEELKRTREALHLTDEEKVQR